MPFANTYNQSIANKVISNAKKDIAIKEKMYDDPASFVEPHSQQEYQTVQHPEVVGGSGNLAATSHDMGYEPTKVGGCKVNVTRAKRVAKALAGEAPPMVITEETTVVKPKRVRKAKTVAGGDLNDVINTVGNVVDTGVKVAKGVAAVAPYVLPLVGLGKDAKPKKSMAPLSEWNELVKKVRAETGKSLKDTLKHIKENNLYKKKGAEAKPPAVKRPRKTKEGGSSGGILINEVVKARTDGDVMAVPRKTGGIPSMRVPKARAKKIAKVTIA